MVTINAYDSYLIGNRTLNSGGDDEGVTEEENPVTQIEKTEPEITTERIETEDKPKFSFHNVTFSESLRYDLNSSDPGSLRANPEFTSGEINDIWGENSNAIIPITNPEEFELNTPIEVSEKEKTIEDRRKEINEIDRMPQLYLNSTHTSEEIKEYHGQIQKAKETLAETETAVKEAIAETGEGRLGATSSEIRALNINRLKAERKIAHYERQFNAAAERLIKDPEYDKDKKKQVAELLGQNQQDIAKINTDPSTWLNGNGEVQLLATNGKSSHYNGKAGMNGTGNGNTAIMERFNKDAWATAIFPELIEKLPSHLRRKVRKGSNFHGGETIAKGFNLLVERNGKYAILRANDVGPGIRTGKYQHASNHYTDLTEKAAKYFGIHQSGTGQGFNIWLVSDDLPVGPVNNPEEILANTN